MEKKVVVRHHVYAEPPESHNRHTRRSLEYDKGYLAGLREVKGLVRKLYDDPDVNDQQALQRLILKIETLICDRMQNTSALG